MRIHLFCHSLVSDWNHGNAHFLRGVVFELARRGHEVRVHEPRASWSRENLERDHGRAPIEGFHAQYPGITSEPYDLATLALDATLEGADLVLVHEWSEPELVRRVGEHRRDRGSYALLFHDTHHRMVTSPDEMARYELAHFDGVLAFGAELKKRYVARGTRDVFVWHEAADVRVFRPGRPERVGSRGTRGDLVWIGNWGDGERADELRTFLVDPVRVLGLRARVHGVRYPSDAIAALAGAGIAYGGFVPNYRAPEVYADYTLTVHVPRRPYVEALVGVPTIRVFEALACGMPLVCSPWHDTEGLFSPGEDFLVVADGAAMTRALRELTHDGARRSELALHGLRTIRARHTCAHRVDELIAICAELGAPHASTRRPEGGSTARGEAHA